jgi:hypothetical protein
VKLLRVLLVLLAILALSNTKAFAWDEIGHQQIADIAWTRLNDKAKKEIAAILMAGDAQTKPASESDADVRAAFRKSASFPDFIKFTKTTIYEDILDSMNKTFFVITPPNPKDNEDNRCKTWHYFDVPIRDRGVHAPKESNALHAIAKARYELATLEAAPNKDRKMQCWWLAWIGHITGDLHQPLHCVSNHEMLPEGDAGGNLFMIKLPGSDRPGRLHGYWDGGITRSIAADKQSGQSADMAEVSARWSRDFPPSAEDAANVDVMSWIRSGAALADNIVYVGIEKDQAPSKGYEQTQTALCRRQAVLGGARLAAILNDILGK